MVYNIKTYVNILSEEEIIEEVKSEIQAATAAAIAGNYIGNNPTLIRPFAM